jgi:hypothetical protein
MAYKRKLAQDSVWKAKNPDKVRMHDKTWRDNNPTKTEAKDHERNRKGGKYYKNKLEYLKTGLPGERHKIRIKHAKRWKAYKKIIAPNSQIHHEWIPGTAKYKGIALVETEQHQHGIIKVIKILNGRITLMMEWGRNSEWCPSAHGAMMCQ